MAASTSRRARPTFAARSLLALGFVAIFAFASQPEAARGACPFCTAIEPTFAERRAEAKALVLGEASGLEVVSGATSVHFIVRQIYDGAEALGTIQGVDCETPFVKLGSLALLLGKKSNAPGGWTWEAILVEEAALGYYLRAPALNKPAAERLPYFAKYLEHADQLVAEDAFSEFGRAPFDAVAGVEASLPYPKFRSALIDRSVPGRRKGFYGMALGLAKNEAELAANRAVLYDLVRAEEIDFRAGFDGILAGLLLADGATALDLIDQRFLANPKAAEGDVRHAQAAIRFYLQFGRAIPQDRLLKSVVLLLDRPATAPEALGDLTRRQAWDHVDRAVKLFVASPGDDPALDRAVFGYLLVDPKADGKPALRKLKADYPMRSKEALHHWESLGLTERT